MLTTTISLLTLGVILTCVASPSSTAYRKIEEYSGSSFFDGFNTFSQTDPTNGYVNYTDFDTAASNNLTAFIWREEMKASNAYIGVDYHQLRTNDTGGRKSVRLASKNPLSVGLLTVIDVLHAPTGPGVWPAVWLLGNTTDVMWPNSGEQDIMEWVNDSPYNSATLHTAPGCTVDRNASYQGRMVHSDCSFNQSRGACSIQAPPTITYDNKILSTAGQGFNNQNGGVYVHEWTKSGVSVWLFPRDNLPPDLVDEKPDPSTWTKAQPLAHFTGSGCNFDQMFQQQQLIINICLCGDWAGEPDVWAPLAAKTGSSTCAEYVATHPESFKDAYFEFASIKMFSSNPVRSGIAGVDKVKRDEEESRNFMDDSFVRESEGSSKTYSTSPTSHYNRHGLLPHTHFHGHRSVAPYKITNTTIARAMSTDENHSTPGLPSTSSTESASSGATTAEGSGELIGDFIAPLFATMM